MMEHFFQDVQIFPSGESFVIGSATRLLTFLQQKLQSQKICTVALAGGNTPRAIYHHLAQLPAEDQPDWKRIHLFWGDERTVPPHQPESNYRMVTESLLKHISIPGENIHRIKGELPPSRAAEEYQEHLVRFFKGKIPEFDLILLGLGDDGHTASLFPGTTAVDEKAKWVTEVFVETLSTWRITLTLPVLNHARQIIFLVAGPSKVGIIEKLATLTAPFPGLPASLVNPASGKVLWLMDEAAGQTLPAKDANRAF